MTRSRRTAALVTIGAFVFVAAAGWAAWRLRRDVRRALDAPVQDARPLQLVPAPAGSAGVAKKERRVAMAASTQ